MFKLTEDMFKVVIQRRIGAAKDSIMKVLDLAAETIPENIEKIRVQETLVRNYMAQWTSTSAQS